MEWLAQWLGMTVDPNAAPAQQRQLLQSAGELHALRGTRRGLELAVQAELGVPVQVVETGASTWSTQPGGDLPGEPVPAVVVVARPGAGQDVDPERLDALVRAIKPAHIQHRVQVAPE